MSFGCSKWNTFSKLRRPQKVLKGYIKGSCYDLLFLPRDMAHFQPIISVKVHVFVLTSTFYDGVLRVELVLAGGNSSSITIIIAQ